MLIEEISRHLKTTLYNPHNLDISTIRLNGVKSLRSAEKNHLSFYDKTRPIEELLQSKAGAIILKEGRKDVKTVQLITEEAKLVMCEALAFLSQKKEKTFKGISDKAFIHEEANVNKQATVYPMAYIDKKAQIGASSIIYPQTYIGEGVVIGEGSIIYPNVTLLNACKIGSNVVIHPGSVVGAEGFGFIPTAQGIKKIPQQGRVIIEDNVQIGSLCNVDSATFDETLIESGTKIDAFVQVGHNVKIGKNNMLCAQVGLAGGAELGDHVICAGQSGVSNGIKLESQTIIGARAAALKNLKKGTYHGFPATEAGEWRRSLVIKKRLPKLQKEMKDLKKRLEELENSLTES